MAAENAMMLLEGSKADVVMIYASTAEETSTWPLMDQLLMRGYYPVFPLVQGEKMVPIMWDENTVFVSVSYTHLTTIRKKSIRISVHG